MAEVQEVQELTARPDTDIEADIQNLIIHYPPLNNDRHQITVTVRDGVAILSGHIRSLNTYDYFMRRLPSVPGLRDVNAEKLYVDENLRLAAGQVLPAGLIANVEYGTVILTGRQPEGITVDEVVARLATIPGVVRVVTALRS
ncbi:MAG: BON domain-containing protein [Chloroflexota bacterium]|nr:MAG: hypothetical protein DIU68_00570 [Chloroflexota bacterium]